MAVCDRQTTNLGSTCAAYLLSLISFSVIRWEQFYADSHYSRGNIARFYSQILILLHTCCVFLGLMQTGLEICWWSFGNPKKKVVFPDFLMSSDYDLGEKSTPKSLGLLWSLADGYSCTYFAWNTSTCLQTLIMYSLSCSETWKQCAKKTKTEMKEALLLLSTHIKKQTFTFKADIPSFWIALNSQFLHHLPSSLWVFADKLASYMQTIGHRRDL